LVETLGALQCFNFHTTTVVIDWPDMQANVVSHLKLEFDRGRYQE
jgi:hypothetical protein